MIFLALSFLQASKNVEFSCCSQILNNKKVKKESLPITFTPKLMLAKTQTYTHTSHTPHLKLKY